MQLGAVIEFHAAYPTHSLLEQNSAMHSELLIDNVIALHYVLHAWRIVLNIPIVSGLVWASLTICI